MFFFFKQKTAYEIHQWLEFRRVLFRSTQANSGAKSTEKNKENVVDADFEEVKEDKDDKDKEKRA